MWEEWKNKFKQADIVIQLIAVNVGVFLVLRIFATLGKWGHWAWAFDGSYFKGYKWLAGSVDLYEMLFKPWSILTYSFLHEGAWHLFMNMLILHFVGSIFSDLLGKKRLLPLYLMGGIAGYILFALSYNLLPYFQTDGNSIILGASASVMAIVVASATYFPNYKLRLVIFGEVPLKIIAIAFFVLDIIALDGDSNVGGRLAHIGGAAYGFFYAQNLKKGKDWGLLASEWVQSMFKPKNKLKVKYRASDSSKAKPKPSKAEKQKIVDAILDKVSQSGYDSLTKAEKDILFKAGQND
jgi:membrane associated rhomboid family serine protease